MSAPIDREWMDEADAWYAVHPLPASLSWDDAHDAHDGDEDAPDVPDGARLLDWDFAPHVDRLPRHTCDRPDVWCDACMVVVEIDRSRDG